MCQSVSPGEYIVRVTHGGFMGSASAVSIAAGAGRIEHEFVLRLAPVASQVVVTGSKLSETMLDCTVTGPPVGPRSNAKPGRARLE